MQLFFVNILEFGRFGDAFFHEFSQGVIQLSIFFAGSSNANVWSFK